jgi:hypothetical protein
MQQYGIGDVARKAVLVRLHDLQSTDAPNLSAYLDALWCGLKSDDDGESLKKHDPESYHNFPGEQMEQNAEDYKFPPAWDDPKEKQKRAERARLRFFKDWHNGVIADPKVKKWVEQERKKDEDAPSLDAVMKMEEKLHEGDPKPLQDWVKKNFPHLWTKKHANELSQKVAEAYEKPEDKPMAWTPEGEKMFWLRKMVEEPGLIKGNPAIKKAAEKLIEWRFESWLDEHLSPAMQKKLIKNSFPEAFTATAKYDKLRTDPHPEMVQAIKNAPITMNFPLDNLSNMTRQGKYLNLHATETGMGETDLDTRANFEEQNFGIGTDQDAPWRPVYGALNWATPFQPGHAHFGAAPDYGDAWLELKDDVRERASFTPGDSFDVEPSDVHGHRNADVLAHAHLQHHPRVAHPLFYKQGGSNWADYIEAQVWGGVDFNKDVRALHLSPELHLIRRAGSEEYDKYVKDAMDFGKKYNVPVYLHLPTNEKLENTKSLRWAKPEAFKVVPLHMPGQAVQPDVGLSPPEKAKAKRAAAAHAKDPDVPPVKPETTPRVNAPPPEYLPGGIYHPDTP